MSAVLAFRQPELAQSEELEKDRESSPRESCFAPRLDITPLVEELAAEGVELEQLEFSLLSAQRSSRSSLTDLANAYGAWAFLTRELHRELGVSWDEASDEFSRQDEWGCLFYGGSCIAIMGFRWVDLRMPHVQRDSYFGAWPNEAFQRLRAHGPEVFILSQMAIADAWRGKIGSVSLKTVMSGLGVERFNKSSANVMIGTMRNSKAMNKMMYGMGAEPLATGLVHPHFREPIDLITVPKRSEDERMPPARNGDLVRYLSRNILIDETPFQGAEHAFFEAV